MGARDAGGTGIEVHVWLIIKLTVMTITDFVYQIAVTKRQDTSSAAVGGFQYSAVIASPRQLIGDS